MKYFIDTEFLKGTQEVRIPFTNISIGKTKPTIDLISIGIVAENGKEYYAISKDFNLKEAWNRYDIKTTSYGVTAKVYWIRENVLKPIFREWYAVRNNIDLTVFDHKFTYKEFKRLLNKYGKTNKQIAEEVTKFIYSNEDTTSFTIDNTLVVTLAKVKPEFYAYYADYDWVAFYWLFGKMNDLPKGFPKYCIDLKQMLDEYVNELYDEKGLNKKLLLDGLKDLPNYPKQTNGHNALADARWNKELYEFLNKIDK